MTPGRVVVLNGTSSSGKTTLAAALRRRLEAENECWVVYSQDDFTPKLPPAWIKAGRHSGRHGEEGFVLEVRDGEFELRVGPVGHAILAAYRGAVAAAAHAGLNVIVDEVTMTQDEWDDWQVRLDGVDTTWVRVELALDELERREAARGDRMNGHARYQLDI
ncbi:MAG: chloramphenicol phosphotransferase, partial [Actinomycetota bacterium]|nr:chloramphenicol phosphotransferase [Actinomycetota bacterium]